MLCDTLARSMSDGLRGLSSRTNGHGDSAIEAMRCRFQVRAVVKQVLRCDVLMALESCFDPAG